jgi:hypothetical protein|tara:strand:+ start:506 stop:808 length:303 start_codon:yes stop_codon:yes gene_type:complete
MAFGHQKLTVAGTAAGLTVPQDCNYAIMSVETGAMRVRVDGTSPTASIGFLVSAGQELKVFGSDQLNNLKMIRVTSDSAVLNIQYGQTSHDIDHRIDING